MLKFNRQPDITAINRALWIPPIGHKNESVRAVLHWQDESGLRVERVGNQFAGTKAWIAEFFPRAKDVFRYRNTRRVRCPTGAIRGDEKIFSAPFHQRRRFMEASGKNADKFSR